MGKRTKVAASSPANGESGEPIGIVISSGARIDEAPRFAAYVWGPVPDADVAEEFVAVA